MKWLPIEDITEIPAMFVVKGFRIPIGAFGRWYDTDPYCVFKRDGKFVRWPHDFPPTHFCLLPDDIEE